MSKVGLNIARFRRAVATHDVENPTHTSYGIGVYQFDLERLGFEEGEELWDGVRIQVDGKTTGNFRVLCDGEHDELKPRTLKEKEEQENKDLEVVGKEMEVVGGRSG